MTHGYNICLDLHSVRGHGFDKHGIYSIALGKLRTLCSSKTILGFDIIFVNFVTAARLIVAIVAVRLGSSDMQR